MGAYILKRLISAIPVLLGITVIVFLIMAMIPGDPATAILGSYATPDNVEKLNRDLGLDKPLVTRYFIWLGNMLTGDFGRTFSLNRPVLDEIVERFNATLILAGRRLRALHASGHSRGRRLGGAPIRVRRQGDHLRRADRHFGAVLLPRHDDDPDVRGEPALAASLGDVRDLRRRRSARPCAPPRHARTRPRGGGDRGDRPAQPFGDAGGAAPGLYPHRARQGRG